MLNKIKVVLSDENINIDLKYRIAKEERSLENKDESFHVIYLNLIGILILYILDHKNKIPKDVHNLYSFIMGSS